MDWIGNFQLPRFSSCEIRPPTHQKFVLDDLDRMGSQEREIMSKDVPQNVPRQYCKSGSACTHMFIGWFRTCGLVSVENKDRLSYFPKLVIRVRFPSPAPNP